MKWTLFPLLILIGAYLPSGCAPTPPTSDFCAVEHAEFLTATELKSMTTERKRQVLAHNEYGAKACGWKGIGS